MQQEIQGLETVGLIGPGYWGKKFLAALRKRGHQVVLANSKTNMKDFFFGGEFQKVFIMTPVETHYDLVHKAIIAGKDVFCEKNFAETHQETEILLSMITNTQTQIMVDFIYSFNPELLHFIPGERNKIAMLQWGKFREECITSMLGSHALSVMDTCVGLDNYDLVGVDLQGDTYPWGARLLYDGPHRFDVEVSIGYQGGKWRYIEGKNTIHLDYENGIDRAIDLFMAGYSNPQTILSVSRGLERIRQFSA